MLLGIGIRGTSYRKTRGISLFRKNIPTGKKKNHTRKNQLIVWPDGKNIVDVVAGKPGLKRGVKLFCESQKGLRQNQKFNGYRADEGESSIRTPHKKPKKQELTPGQKERNRQLANDANFCCTLNSWTVKIFRVAQERFRLNSSKYEQIIMTICRLVRLGICTFIL